MFRSTPICHRPAATDNNSNNDIENREDNFTIVKNNLLIDAVSTSVDRVDFASRSFKNPLTPMNSDNTVHGIREILSRPIICPSGNISWTTAQVIGDNIFTMSVPGGMFNPGTPWGDKLAGFLGFKGTFCFKIQLNCQRFQAGIALVSVMPASSHVSTIRKALVQSNIAYKSQLPSVRYNIAELDEVEIRVPFVSPELFFNRTAPIDWATVYVDVYAQLTGGDIKGICWCWFEDVELFHPTAMSGMTASSKTKGRKVAFQDREDPGGMLSTPLSTFSRAFQEVATNIPMLSSVAYPTSWFLAAASKAASAFGFSSTVSTESRIAVVPKSLPHQNNCDTNDTSDSLALTVGNKISHLPGFAGMDIDEMSLQYICQIPSYIQSYTWTTSNVYGNEILNIRVGPTLSFRSLTVTPSVGTAVPAYIFAPCGYVATSFAYWRGSLKYRFFLRKTDFHTGRLLFTFAPAYNLAASNIIENNIYMYKWIWDIADSHSFEITIPYVSSVPWTSTFASDASSIGSLKAFVLTPLNAPATVSNNVVLVTEMCGGDDFEVGAFETNQPWTPIIAYSSDLNINRRHKHRQRPFIDEEGQKKSLLVKKKKIKQQRAALRDAKIFAQGPLSVDQDKTTAHIPTSSMEHGSSVHDFNSYNALYTTGESVKSLRQILKRTGWFYSRVHAADPSVALRWNPFIPYLSTTFQGGSQVLMDTNYFHADYYTKFVSMFALRRGALIVKSLSSTDNGSSIMRLSYAGSAVQGCAISLTGALNADNNCTESRVITVNRTQGALDVLVPYYSRTTSSPVLHLSNYAGGLTDTRYYSSHQALTNYTSLGTGTTTFTVGRQVADDFSLGGFIGVLPLTGGLDNFP